MESFAAVQSQQPSDFSTFDQNRLLIDTLILVVPQRHVAADAP